MVVVGSGAMWMAGDRGGVATGPLIRCGVDEWVPRARPWKLMVLRVDWEAEEELEEMRQGLEARFG